MAEGGRFGKYLLMGTGAVVAGALVARRISYTESGVKVLDVQRVGGAAATTSSSGGGTGGGDSGGPGSEGGDSGPDFFDDSMKFVAEHWQEFAIGALVLGLATLAFRSRGGQTAHA